MEVALFLVITIPIVAAFVLYFTIKSAIRDINLHFDNDDEEI